MLELGGWRAAGRGAEDCGGGPWHDAGGGVEALVGRSKAGWACRCWWGGSRPKLCLSTEGRLQGLWAHSGHDQCGPPLQPSMWPASSSIWLG